MAILRANPKAILGCTPPKYNVFDREVSLLCTGNKVLKGMPFSRGLWHGENSTYTRIHYLSFVVVCKNEHGFA